MFNRFRKISLAAFTVLLISSFSFSQDDLKVDPSSQQDHEKKSSEPSGIVLSDGILYGKDYDVSMTVMEFSDIMKNAQELDGKTILVKGNVSDVCQKMGCWMSMSDGSNTARVVTQHEFFLPKDISGRDAVVIGQFNITEISEDVAKHYNDESKNPGMKSEDIKGPQKGFEIQATGIKILNPSSDPVQK